MLLTAIAGCKVAHNAQDVVIPRGQEGRRGGFLVTAAKIAGLGAS